MDGKRIVILGAGESGIGAALLAKAKGLIPFVSDSGKILPEYKEVLMRNSIPHEEGQHDEKYLLTADEVVKSPGIPDYAPIIEKLEKKNIPIGRGVVCGCGIGFREAQCAVYCHRRFA